MSLEVNMNSFIANDEKINSLDKSAFKDDSYFTEDYPELNVKLKKNYFRRGII